MSDKSGRGSYTPQRQSTSTGELLRLAQESYHPDKGKARRFALRALNQAEQEHDSALAARAANLAADILRMEGKVALALKLSRLGLTHARTARDARAETDSLNDLGLIFWHKGEFDQAVKYLTESLDRTGQTGDEQARSRAYVNLSLLSWEKGDLPQAMDYQHQSLALKQKVGDRYGIGLAQLNLGLIYCDMGDWEKAIECYYRSLVEMEKHGDLTDVALGNNNLAEIYLRRGRLDKARELLEQAIRIAEQVPSAWVKAEALGNLGEVYFRQGDSFRARDCYEQDLKLCSGMNDKEELAETLRRMGELQSSLGDLDGADRSLKRAMKLTRKSGAGKEAGNIWRALGNLHAARRGFPAAARAFASGREALQRFPDSYEMGRLLLDFGRMLTISGDQDQAASVLEPAEALFRRLGATHELGLAGSYLGKARQEKERSLNLLESLSRLATRADSLPEFSKQALDLLQESFQATAGALVVHSAATITNGDFAPDELEALCRRPDKEISAQAVWCPLRTPAGLLGAFGLKWPEPDRAVLDPVLLETIASILVLGIERLADREPAAALESLGTAPGFPAPSIARGNSRGQSLRVIVGAETSLKGIFAAIRQAAPTRACVLVLGESGTGKELIARTVHDLSDRAAGPFVAINCAAIPETLLESELFGIEKGTATGVTERKGKFELASGGTVFLDEIGDMSLTLQAKVLRLLQEKEFERVGGRNPVKVDIRVIAATNQDLERAIAEHKFREDLFYRLNVVVVALPPLRARKSDIPQLVNHFIHRYSREYSRKLAGINDDALAKLMAHSWHGNVRELENVVERAVVLARQDRICLADLPPALQQLTGEGQDYRGAKTVARSEAQVHEKDFVLQTLNRSGWNVSRAAQALNITRRHLYRLMKKYGLTRV